MNTYKFIFTREDGTQGTDHFASSVRLALADPAKRAESRIGSAGANC